MSTSNLAPDVADDQVSAPVHPLDAGLGLDHWAKHDPAGFVAACRDAIDANDLLEMALAMILSPAQPFHCPGAWTKTIEKALAREVDRGANWLDDWQRGE